MLTAECAVHVIREIMKITPSHRSSLNFENPFQLLAATILSAQATDVSVNQATPALFERFPTPEAMAEADPKAIEPYIQSIGLYRNKAKFLQQMAQQLVENFHSQVPADREALMSLKGVGRKTANVVLSNAFGIPAFAVDTHVSRICKHHHIVPANWTVEQIEERVCHILPEEEWSDAHHSMIHFGRQICTPRKPTCTDYPQLYTCLEEIPDEEASPDDKR